MHGKGKVTNKQYPWRKQSKIHEDKERNKYERKRRELPETERDDGKRREELASSLRRELIYTTLHTSDKTTSDCYFVMTRCRFLTANGFLFLMDEPRIAKW